MIQFPKATIENVKVFVTKEPGDLVNIFLFVHLQKRIQKITASNFSASNSATVTFVNAIKYSSNDSHGILFLKLCVVAQKLEALLSHKKETVRQKRRLLKKKITKSNCCRYRDQQEETRNSNDNKILERTG